MLEVLQFYVSSFWVWAGITIGLYTVLALLLLSIAAICEAVARLITTVKKDT